MNYKITMVKSITDEGERRLRLRRLAEILSNNKTAANVDVSEATPLTTVETNNTTRTEPKK